jgi:hypothetical protein
VSRSPLAALTSAGVLVAYLAMLLLAAPCTCFAAAEDGAAAACCCGPEAASPCRAPESDGRDPACDGHLGAGCAHALPEASAAEAAPWADELTPPAPAAVLVMPLAEPQQARLACAARGRPHPPASRLELVRSTVLLI